MKPFSCYYCYFSFFSLILLLLFYSIKANDNDIPINDCDDRFLFFFCEQYTFKLNKMLPIVRRSTQKTKLSYTIKIKPIICVIVSSITLKIGNNLWLNMVLSLIILNVPLNNIQKKKNKKIY